MKDRGGDESGWEAGEGEMSSADHANQRVELRRRWAAGCQRRRQSLNLSCRASNVARAKRQTMSPRSAALEMQNAQASIHPGATFDPNSFFS
jgi:hypothetical protein